MQKIDMAKLVAIKPELDRDTVAEFMRDLAGSTDFVDRIALIVKDILDFDTKSNAERVVSIGMALTSTAIFWFARGIAYAEAQELERLAQR